MKILIEVTMEESHPAADQRKEDLLNYVADALQEWRRKVPLIPAVNNIRVLRIDETTVRQVHAGVAQLAEQSLR